MTIEPGDPKLLETLHRRDQTAYGSENCWSRPESWLVNDRNYVSKTIRSF